jgi:UDP-N-acetylmuramoyl-L-alanyl-D-glutamate--2,6-diaminopimelate ligase
MRVGSNAVSGYPRPRRGIPRAVPGLALSATGITHASAGVRAGDVYAGLPGARRHGAEFAAQAAAAGAVAIVTDARGAALVEAAGVRLPVLVTADPRATLGPLAAAIYGDPTGRLPVIGITGTAGKTSTSYLIESGLRAAGHLTCMIGTVQTRLGDVVVRSQHTTPEATDLQALFAVAVEAGVTAAVMEVSSHALAYHRVGGTRFAVGGYTNFGLDHLDFHANVAEYFAAKARLFDGRCRVEVLNADDPALAPLRKPATVLYSAAGSGAAAWRADGIQPDGYGQRFRAYGPDGLVLPAAVRLPGRHNVANALLAIACLVAVGVDPVVAAGGVADCPGVPGRMQAVGAPGPVLGVVDYAHKPDAIVEVLAALRGLPTGQVVCVLGAGGDRDRGKRPVMGAAAARGADVVIVTDDNPRTEDPGRIRAEVLAGAQSVSGGAKVIEVAGRREAIAEAVRLAAAGDVIAVLGKGHETGQEIGGDMHPFDDRDELTAALRQRFAGRS